MDIDTLVEEVIKILRIENTMDNVESIEILINRVLEDIEMLCNRDFATEEVLPKGLESLVVDMTIYRYNIRGYEHLSSEGINEISRSFNGQYPDYILSRIKRLRRVRIY